MAVLFPENWTQKEENMEYTKDYKKKKVEEYLN